MLQPQRLCALSLTLAMCTFAACAGPSTTIEQQWRTSDPSVAELTNVVTWCIVEDVAVRRSCEDDMAQQLGRIGVRATPLYSIVAETEMQDRAAAKQKLLASGYDGLIAMRLVSRDHELQYVPGTFDDYWGMPYDPGYLYTETVVRIESSAYSLRDRELVWSALSKTIDPDNMDNQLDQVTSLVATQLQKERVVAARPSAPPPAT